MGDMGGKFIEFVIVCAIVLSVLTSYLAGLIKDAMTDPNLSAYAGILGVVTLLVIIGLIRYAWKTFK
jgi:hypothetical protein